MRIGSTLSRLWRFCSAKLCRSRRDPAHQRYLLCRELLSEGWFHLCPTQDPEAQTPAMEELRRQQEQEELHQAAQDYQSLLDHRGWRRFEAAIREEAQFAADVLVCERIRPGETAEAYTLRQAPLREFIAACALVPQLPGRIIAQDQEESLKE